MKILDEQGLKVLLNKIKEKEQEASVEYVKDILIDNYYKLIKTGNQVDVWFVPKEVALKFKPNLNHKVPSEFIPKTKQYAGLSPILIDSNYYLSQLRVSDSMAILNSNKDFLQQIIGFTAKDISYVGKYLLD